MAPPPQHHHHHHHHQQQHHNSSRQHHALPPLQTERDSKHEGGSSFPSRWSRESHRRDEGPQASNNEPSSSQQQQLPSYSSYASMAVGPAPKYPKTNPGSSNNSTTSTAPHANTNPTASNANNSRHRSASEDTFRSEKSTSLQNIAPLSSHRYSSSSSQQQAPPSSSYRRNNPPYGGTKDDEHHDDRWDRNSRNPSRGGGGVGHYTSNRGEADMTASSSSSSWRGGRGSSSNFPSSSSLSRRPMDRIESGNSTTPPPPSSNSQRSNSPSQRFSGGRGGGGSSYHNPRSMNSTYNRSSGDIPPHRDDGRRSTNDDELQHGSFNSTRSSSSWNRYQDSSKDTSSSRFPVSSRHTDGNSTFQRSTSNEYRRASATGTGSPPPSSRGPSSHAPPARGGGMLRVETPLVDRYPSSDLTRDASTTASAGGEGRRWSSPPADPDSNRNFQPRNSFQSKSDSAITDTVPIGSNSNVRHGGSPPLSQPPQREGRAAAFQSPSGGTPPSNMFRPSEKSSDTSSRWNQQRTIQSTASSESKEGGLVIEEGEERNISTTPRYNSNSGLEKRNSYTRGTDAPPHQQQDEQQEPERPLIPHYRNSNIANKDSGSFNDDNSRRPVAGSRWNRNSLTTGSDRALEDAKTATYYEPPTATRTLGHAGDTALAKTGHASHWYLDREDNAATHPNGDERKNEKPDYYNSRETNSRRTGEETTTSFGGRRGGWSGSSNSRPYYPNQSGTGGRPATTPTSAASTTDGRPFRGREDGGRPYNKELVDEWRRSSSPPFHNKNKVYDDDNKSAVNRDHSGTRGGDRTAPPLPRGQVLGARGLSRSSDPDQDRASAGLRWEPPPSVTSYSAAADQNNDYSKRKREESSGVFSGSLPEKPDIKKSRVDESDSSGWQHSGRPDEPYRTGTTSTTSSQVGIGTQPRSIQMSRSYDRPSQGRDAAFSDRSIHEEQSRYSSYDRKADGNASYYSNPERHRGADDNRDTRTDRPASGNVVDGEPSIPKRHSSLTTAISSSSANSSWRMRSEGSFKSPDLPSTDPTMDNNLSSNDAPRQDSRYSRHSSDSYHNSHNYYNKNSVSELDRGSNTSYDAGARNPWTPSNTSSWTPSKNRSPSGRNTDYASFSAESSHQQSSYAAAPVKEESSLTRAPPPPEHHHHHHSTATGSSLKDDTTFVPPLPPPPPPPPLPEETSTGEDDVVVVKVEPVEENEAASAAAAAAAVVAPTLVPPSPPPSPRPASGVFVANTRLMELQAQMEFSYAKYLKLLREHEQLKAQYQVLETLPVGLDAIKEELDAMPNNTPVKVEPKVEGNVETMDET